MRSVLLVDPHADTLDLYSAFFTLEGVNVRTAGSAVVALTLAPSVDAVVTEIQLPGEMDGLGLVRALRATPVTRHLAIVVLSACAFPAQISESWSSGCDLFLSKPCLPGELLVALKHVEEPRRLRMARVTSDRPAAITFPVKRAQ